jgi:hypothetical protein
MAHCQNVAELLHYTDSTLQAIGTSQALAAKDKKKLQKSCRAECELHMRRLTQSGGTSSGRSSYVGTIIGAEEHMDQAAIQRQGRQEGHCQGPEGQGQGPKGQGQAPAPTGTNW